MSSASHVVIYTTATPTVRLADVVPPHLAVRFGDDVELRLMPDTARALMVELSRLVQEPPTDQKPSS